MAHNLTNVVGDAALHAHLHGDDYEAIKRVRDVRHLARDLDQQPFLVSHLVSIGMTAVAMQRLQVILPDLQIEEAKTNPTTTGQRPATQAQLSSLLQQLSDDGSDNRFLSQSIAFERVSIIEDFDTPRAALALRRCLTWNCSRS